MFGELDQFSRLLRPIRESRSEGWDSIFKGCVRASSGGMIQDCVRDAVCCLHDGSSGIHRDFELESEMLSSDLLPW